MVGETVSFRDRDSGRGGTYRLENGVARQLGTPEAFLPTEISAKHFDLLYKAKQQLGGVELDVQLVRLVLGLPVPKDVEEEAAKQLDAAQANVDAATKLLEAVRAEQESIAKLTAETTRLLELARAAAEASRANAERPQAVVNVPEQPAPVINVAGAQIDLAGVGQGLVDGLSDLVGEVEDPIKLLTDTTGKAVSTFLPEKALERPEESDEYATKVFLFATGAGLGAAGLAAVPSLVPTVSGSGVTYLAALLGKVSGWDPVFDAVWHTRIDAALGRPAGYKWAKIYRPNVPSEQLLEQLLIKRKISGAEFRDWMGYHGISDAWIERAEAIAFRDLAVRDLAIVAQGAPLDGALARRVLEKQGYGDEEIELLLPGILLNSVRQELGIFRALADRAFKGGVMDEAEYRAALESTAIDPRWIDPIVALQKRVLQLDHVEEEQRLLEEQFRAGRIAESDARARLNALGINAAVVEVRLERIRLRKELAASATAKRIAERQEREAHRVQRAAALKAQRDAAAEAKGAEKTRLEELRAAAKGFSVTDLEGAFKRDLLTAGEVDAMMDAQGLAPTFRELKLQLWMAELEDAAARAAAKTGGTSGG